VPPAARAERHAPATEVESQDEPAEEVEPEKAVRLDAEREVVRRHEQLGANAAEGADRRYADERARVTPVAPRSRA
jgi:hypothetical protein